MINDSLFIELLERYISGEITTQELQKLKELIHLPEYESVLSEKLEESFKASAFDEADLPLSTKDFISGVHRRLAKEEENNNMLRPLRAKVILNYRQWIAAASVLVAIATGVFFFIQYQNKNIAIPKQHVVKADVPPGSNKAILQLANGATIELDEKGNVQLPSDSGVRVMKNGSELTYIPNALAGEIKYNRVITPATGQYRLTLADGTKVWLDAMSSIYFPTSFRNKERVVEITGQVYFEVARNVIAPFIVKAGNSTVEVLGTRFNINAYDNETALKATLLQGAIQVHSAEQQLRLYPGQQAQIDASGKLKMATNVNLEEALAWKDGLFRFDGSDIKTIMRQLERWYGVKAEYKDNIQGTFVAKIPRDVPLAEILKLLELTKQVHFEIEGKKVIVSAT